MRPVPSHRSHGSSVDLPVFLSLRLPVPWQSGQMSSPVPGVPGSGSSSGMWWRLGSLDCIDIALSLFLRYQESAFDSVAKQGRPSFDATRARTPFLAPGGAEPGELAPIRGPASLSKRHWAISRAPALENIVPRDRHPLARLRLGWPTLNVANQVRNVQRRLAP